MENKKIRMPRKPQLPTELAIHYIVKDYQRMFNERESYLERIQYAQKELVKQEDKTYKARRELETLKSTYKDKLQKAQKEVEEKDEALKQMSTELAEANGKIQKLIEVLVDPSKKEEVLADVLRPRIVGKKDLEWIAESLRQLQKANERLTLSEGRLRESYEILKKVERVSYDIGEVKSAVGRLPKVFSRIDSALQRIDNFFKIVGAIKVEKDENT